MSDEDQEKIIDKTKKRSWKIVMPTNIGLVGARFRLCVFKPIEEVRRKLYYWKMHIVIYQPLSYMQDLKRQPYPLKIVRTLKKINEHNFLKIRN